MDPKNKTCPGCKSARLWHMSTQMEGTQCIILFSCLDCNRTYREIYSLVYDHTEEAKQQPGKKYMG